MATDIAAFNLYAGRQDMQPPLKSMPLLSNQQQMTRRQSFPFTYSNKLLIAKGTAWKSTLVSVHKKTEVGVESESKKFWKNEQIPLSQSIFSSEFLKKVASTHIP